MPVESRSDMGDKLWMCIIIIIIDELINNSLFDYLELLMSAETNENPRLGCKLQRID